MSDPTWLFLLPDVPFDRLRSAGVAIVPTGPGRWHAGMLHRAGGGGAHLLHLAWDHDLRNTLPSHQYAWVQLDLPPARLLSIAAMCRRIAKLHARPGGGLPYAFRYRETAFSADGRILLGKSEHGLTCATFILAVLSSTGIELLSLAEWPHRDDDIERHSELLDLLRRDSRITADHLAAVAAEKSCVRYRPEEVVGAASWARLPVSFIDAQTAAGHIKRTFAVRATSTARPP
jgi:hypothetical protein